MQEIQLCAVCFCCGSFNLFNCINLLVAGYYFIIPRSIFQFVWLSGRQKGSFFVKMFKNLLLRNHIGDEAETWHTCLGH